MAGRGTLYYGFLIEHTFVGNLHSEYLDRDIPQGTSGRGFFTGELYEYGPRVFSLGSALLGGRLGRRAWGEFWGLAGWLGGDTSVFVFKKRP